MDPLTLKIDSLTEAEYQEALAAVCVLATSPMIRQVRSLLYGALGAGLVLSLLAHPDAGVILFASSICGLLVLKLSLAGPTRRKLLTAYLSSSFPLSVTFADDQIHVVGAHSDGTVSLAWFAGWKELRTVIVAYSPRGAAGMYVFPKRILGENGDALKAWLSQKIGR